MKGYTPPVVEPPRMAVSDDWLALAAEAVGNVIEFWGFKRNHGRVWAYLYLLDKTATAAELQEGLALSKGGVSMITRELERWGVITRERDSIAGVWRFRAETNLVEMIRRVVRERESVFISRVRADLERAEALAKDAGAPADVIKRMKRMRLFADAVERAMHGFLKTAQFDLRGAAGALKGRVRSALGDKKRRRK